MNPQITQNSSSPSGATDERDYSFEIVESVLKYALGERVDDSLAKSEAGRLVIMPDRGIIVVFRLYCGDARAIEHRVLIAFPKEHWVDGVGRMLDTVTWTTGSHHDGLVVLLSECWSEAEASGHARLAEVLMKQMSHFGDIPPRS